MHEWMHDGAACSSPFTPYDTSCQKSLQGAGFSIPTQVKCCCFPYMAGLMVKQTCSSRPLWTTPAHLDVRQTGSVQSMVQILWAHDGI